MHWSLLLLELPISGVFIQFSKFHEDVIKLDKVNFKRELTVAFKVKNL